MVRAGNRDSGKRIFGPLKILPLPSQYIYSLVMFVKNMDLFLINNDRYTTETRNSNKNLFKKTLLQFLYLHSFYSIEEFF
jgi:hypothetical protein